MAVLDRQRHSSMNLTRMLPTPAASPATRCIPKAPCEADKAGLQVMIHAIGDRANDLIFTIYEQVEREDGKRDRRFRIEHAQHLRRQDIQRFARDKVVASMQPYHAIDDGRW